jgi:hypothetical protein
VPDDDDNDDEVTRTASRRGEYRREPDSNRQRTPAQYR